MHSGRVVDVDELVRQPQLRRDLCGQRGRAVTLGGVMPASQKGDTGLARQVHMLLGDFAAEKHIHTEVQRSLEQALGGFLRS